MPTILTCFFISSLDLSSKLQTHIYSYKPDRPTQVSQASQTQRVWNLLIPFYRLPLVHAVLINANSFHLVVHARNPGVIIFFYFLFENSKVYSSYNMVSLACLRAHYQDILLYLSVWFMIYAISGTRVSSEFGPDNSEKWVE